MDLMKLSLLEHEETETSPVQEAVPEESLVTQAGRYYRPDEPGVVEDAAVDVIPLSCKDSYVRRSPVQPYRVPPEYGKRRRRKWILMALAAAAAVLAAVLILRNGIIKI